MAVLRCVNVYQIKEKKSRTRCQGYEVWYLAEGCHVPVVVFMTILPFLAILGLSRIFQVLRPIFLGLSFPVFTVIIDNQELLLMWHWLFNP